MSAARPLYETRADLARERSVARRVEEAWDVKAEKLPIAQRIDFVLKRGREVVAWCEIKQRRRTVAEVRSRGGYLLDVPKLNAARDLAIATGRPFVLVLELLDDVLFARFLPEPWAFRGSPETVVVCEGRTDRGDAADVCPAIRIPFDRFRRLP